jgi:hypothetical protein
MFLIVFAHNRSIFPELVVDKATAVEGDKWFKFLSYIYGIPLIARLIFAIVIPFVIAIIPALLIVAGYGLRKRTVSKGFSIWGKELVKPYVITMILTILLNCIVHYSFFRYMPGAVSESLKVFGGMALGLSQTFSFGNVTLFANGPVWYLLAMFWSMSLFNLVLNKVEEKRIPHVVLACSILGWLLSYVKYTPWCISQGLVGILYVYLGYYLKKTKFFSKEFSRKEKVLYAVWVIVPNMVLCSFGLITEMADNVYSLGPITYIENGLFGILSLYLFLRLNVLQGKISGLIRMVGRYSLYVMCVHSVEMIAIPWYKFGEKLADHPLFGFISAYIIRLIIIFIGVFIVIRVSGCIDAVRGKRDATE